MPNWKKLEQDISSWLSGYASQRIEFRNSYQAIIGFPYDGFRSDGMLFKNNILIAIEVEAGQTHPDTNVGKYWLLYESGSYKKIVLFHIYTPNFNSYGWRKKLAEFYVKKMAPDVNIEYVLLDYRAVSNYKSTLAEIKKRISKKIKEEFHIK